MKRVLMVAVAAWGVWTVAGPPALAQPLSGGAFSVQPLAIPGGGAVGTSGGIYTLGAAIEAAPAGVVQGGAFTLCTGVWCLPLQGITTSVPVADMEPATSVLRFIAPNPFHESTVVAFDLPRGGAARMDIYDVSGRRVRTLLEGNHGAGRFHVTWSGDDRNGQRVASGIYFLRFESGNAQVTRRIVKIN